MLTFELLATEGEARRGRLTLNHGVVETPAFMPVGTYGTVKAVMPASLEAMGAQIILGNTFHLWLRPGLDVVRGFGGLHRFENWSRPILTDSGGFQVWSLGEMRTIAEHGVRFASPVNGDKLLLTPEVSMQIQHVLNSDIAMQFDECTAYETAGHRTTEAEARTSMALSLRWARRCRDEFVRLENPNALFGIVQGGSFPDLRARAAAETIALGFDGYAIGGMAVGEPKPLTRDLTEATAALLPVERPRYLMGVGKPEDLVEAVARGVDMFDCVLPTRNARNGQVFTPDGPLTLKQARWTRDPAPLQADCPCHACRRFSRAYLRHLFMAQELLVYRLLSLHNLHFFLGLMAAMRAAIAAGAFGPFRTRFFDRYAVAAPADAD